MRPIRGHFADTRSKTHDTAVQETAFCVLRGCVRAWKAVGSLTGQCLLCLQAPCCLVVLRGGFTHWCSQGVLNCQDGKYYKSANPVPKNSSFKPHVAFLHSDLWCAHLQNMLWFIYYYFFPAQINTDYLLYKTNRKPQHFSLTSLCLHGHENTT